MMNLLSLPCACDSSLKSLRASQTYFSEGLDYDSFIWFQLNFVTVESQRFMWIAMGMHFSLESLQCPFPIIYHLRNIVVQ